MIMLTLNYLGGEREKLQQTSSSIVLGGGNVQSFLYSLLQLAMAYSLKQINIVRVRYQ